MRPAFVVDSTQVQAFLSPSVLEPIKCTELSELAKTLSALYAVFFPAAGMSVSF